MGNKGQELRGQCRSGAVFALFLFSSVVSISCLSFLVCFLLSEDGESPALSTSLVPRCLGGGPGHGFGKEVTWGKITYKDTDLGILGSTTSP